MKTSSIATGTVFFTIGLIIVGLGGWIANIVKLADMAADPLTAMFVLRIIGIFVAPLGSILGLFV